MMMMTEMTRILFSEPSSYTCAHCGLLLDSALALIQVCGDKVLMTTIKNEQHRGL